MPWNVAKRIRNVEIRPFWIGSSDRFWYRRQTETGHEFIVVDAATGRRLPAFDHGKLADALQRSGVAADPGDLPFDHVTYADGSTIDFVAGKKPWRYDLRAGELTAGPYAPSDAEIASPDGRWAAFLKGHDIALREIATGRLRMLTTDGEAHWAYGKSPDSNLSTITYRRAGVTPPPAVLWSPDSRLVFTHRIDERRVKPLHLHQSVPEDGSVRPVMHEIRVPMVGDDHLTMAQHLIVAVDSGRMTNIEGPAQLFANGSTIERDRAWWSEDGRFVYFVDHSRGEKSYTLCRVEAATGKLHRIKEERGATFVEPNLTPAERVNIRTLPGGKEIVWFSQADGWGHLYLCDGETGAIKNRITHGEWVVRDILHVDPGNRTILFAAGGIDSAFDPYLRLVCRASLDGGKVEVLTPEEMDHSVAVRHPRLLIAVPLDVHKPAPLGVSPSGKFFVETQSRIDRPPVSQLRDATDGRVIATLEVGDISEIERDGWRWPERFKVKAADGKTDLYGALWLPTGFEAGRKYPVLDFIYPGPQRIQTPKHSFVGDFSGLRAYVLAQAFAELGLAVVTLDARGTPLRSKAFIDYHYGRMESGGGLDDHVAGFRQLAATRPYLDLDRVGITGHSGGGFASTRALFLYPDFYKVAVASSGNHDQRGYLQQWGEKYQGLMAEGASYDAQANASIAHRLKGKLMLAYADMDDNVPPALTLQVASALIDADKDFDLLVMPNRNHLSIYRDSYFFRRTFEYFLRHLVGVEPEPGYRMSGVDDA
jgi:dipeptidyl aminopeptidase/acylaminoacyl peptidase